MIRHALAMVEFMNWLDLGLWLSVGLLRLKYCIVEFVNTITLWEKSILKKVGEASKRNSG